jgi:hypothetical protein
VLPVVSYLANLLRAIFYKIPLVSDYLGDAIESGHSYEWPGGLGISASLESSVHAAMLTALAARARAAALSTAVAVGGGGGLGGGGGCGGNEAAATGTTMLVEAHSGRLTIREVREFMTTSAEYWEVRFAMLHIERTSPASAEKTLTCENSLC